MFLSMLRNFVDSIFILYILVVDKQGSDVTCNFASELAQESYNFMSLIKENPKYFSTKHKQGTVAEFSWGRWMQK